MWNVLHKKSEHSTWSPCAAGQLCQIMWHINSTNCPLLFIQDLLSIQPTHHLPFLLLFMLESCSLTCHVFCFHFYLLHLLLFSLLCMPFSFLLLCDNLPCFSTSPFAFFPLCTIM